MKNYTLVTYRTFYQLLQEIVTEGSGIIKRGSIQIAEMPPPPGVTLDSGEVMLSVNAESDSAFFDLGFWLERFREQKDRELYDLKHETELKVNVPVGYNLICNTFKVSPTGVLEGFANDLAQDPFGTNGSDERHMAIDYFLRAYDQDPDEDLGAIFGELQDLKKEWYNYGTPRMAEYKAYFSKKIGELEAAIK